VEKGFDRGRIVACDITGHKPSPSRARRASPSPSSAYSAEPAAPTVTVSAESERKTLTGFSGSEDRVPEGGRGPAVP
jgi:hypothetical protein